MRRLLRGHGVVDRASQIPQFATLVTEAGTGAEVAGRHLARRGEDRADLAQEQRLANKPGHQDTEKHPRPKKHDVAEEHGVQVGAVGSQGDPERDPRARKLSAKLQRLCDVQTLDAVEAGQAPHASRSVERRGPLPRVLPDVLLQIDRAILDHALTVENGQHGARRKAGTFDEPRDPVEVDAREDDGRENAELVDDGLRDIEAGFEGGRIGKKGPGREVERAPGTLEREPLVDAGLLIERYGACPHIAGRAVGEQQVVVQPIFAQGIDQLARCHGRGRDDIWIRRQRRKPVRAPRDAVVHLPLQQADDPRRQIRQSGEAPLPGQPLVVHDDDERRHQGDEHERDESRFDRGENRGDAIEELSRPAPHPTRSISVAEAHLVGSFVPGGIAGLWLSATLQSTRGRDSPMAVLASATPV